MKKYIFGILSILLILPIASADIKATFQSLTFKNKCSSFLQQQLTMEEFKAETTDSITDIQLDISMDIFEENVKYTAKVEEKSQPIVNFSLSGQMTEPNQIATISGISGTYTKDGTKGLKFIFDELKEKPSFCLSTYCLSSHQNNSQTINYIESEPYFFIELTEPNDKSTKPIVKVDGTVIKECIATASVITCYPTEEEVPPEKEPTEKTVKVTICGEEVDTEVKVKFIKFEPKPVTGVYEKLEFDKSCVNDIRDLKLYMLNFNVDVGDFKNITSYRLLAGIEGFSGSGVSEDITEIPKASVEFQFKDAMSTTVYGKRVIKSIDGTFSIGEETGYSFLFNTSLKGESFCYERFCLKQNQEAVQKVNYAKAQKNFTIKLSNAGKETDTVVVKANGKKVESCSVFSDTVTCEADKEVMVPGEGEDSKDYNISLKLCDEYINTGITVQVSNKNGSSFLVFSYVSLILVFLLI